MIDVQMQQVQPHELHDWWDQVKEDLEYCRVQDKEETWLEDIYCTLRNNQAWLLVAVSGRFYRGMMVITQHQDQWNPKRKWIHVWYSRVRENCPEAIDAGLAYLDEMARRIGAEMITFRASREAFGRWGKKHGFTVGEIELRREVKHG